MHGYQPIVDPSAPIGTAATGRLGSWGTGMSSFHHRYYHYARMMLRRYPKMRNEAFGRRGNAGTRAICERKDIDKHVEFPTDGGADPFRALSAAAIRRRSFHAGEDRSGPGRKEQKTMSELYFSLDVETDGPIAPLNSMRQVGMTAFDLTRCPISQFKANLMPLREASEDPDTMRWWMETAEKRARWDMLQINARPPEVIIPDLLGWVTDLAEQEKADPICCASPAGYDWCFLRYYTIRYAFSGQESVFRHCCWDARSHAMGILAKPYLKSGKAGGTRVLASQRSAPYPRRRRRRARTGRAVPAANARFRRSAPGCHCLG